MTRSTLSGRTSGTLTLAAIMLCVVVGCTNTILTGGNRNFSAFSEFQFEYDYASSGENGDVRKALIQQGSDGGYEVQLTVFMPSIPELGLGTEEQLPTRSLTAVEISQMHAAFSSVEISVYYPTPNLACYGIMPPTMYFTWDSTDFQTEYCSFSSYEYVSDAAADVIYAFLQGLVPSDQR